MSQSEMPMYSSSCFRAGGTRALPPASGDRAADDLDERDAGTIEIDGVAFAKAIVNRFAGILLEVGARRPRDDAALGEEK